MCKSDSGQFDETSGSQAHLLEILKRDKKKLNELNVVFVTTDDKNRIIWLETGNDNSGLTHIIQNHNSQFEQLGIPTSEIKNLLKNSIHNKKPLNSYYDLDDKGRLRVNRVYSMPNNDNKHYLVIGIGTNGYIVSAFPTSQEYYLTYKGVDKNGKEIQ